MRSFHAREHTITSLTLELNEPEDAFRRLEEWLRGHGFFAPGGEDLVAQLYLGYGLSRVIRRHDAPPPPEPCRLPLLACVVRRDNYIVSSGNDGEERKVSEAFEMEGVEAFETGPWSRTWPEPAYGAAITAVREAIGRGDVYQVNLVQHFEASFRGSPRALAASLDGLTQPREWPLAEPDWRLLEIGAADDARGTGQAEGQTEGRTESQGGGWAIVSASPELFLARQGRRVWTMPIKGTRPSGWGAELHASPKDAAEHVMIVDLERNDLSRVCEPGTVRWPELMTTASLAGVEHMVSLVEGRLRENVGLAELARGDLPGWLDHGCAEDCRGRSHCGARAGGSRSVHGGAGPRARQRRPRACPDHSDVCDQGRSHPSLGGRRDRVGLRPGGRDRGVGHEGSTAPCGDRRSTRPPSRSTGPGALRPPPTTLPAWTTEAAAQSVETPAAPTTRVGSRPDGRTARSRRLRAGACRSDLADASNRRRRRRAWTGRVRDVEGLPGQAVPPFGASREARALRSDARAPTTGRRRDPRARAPSGRGCGTLIRRGGTRSLPPVVLDAGPARGRAGRDRVRLRGSGLDRAGPRARPATRGA